MIDWTEKLKEAGIIAQETEAEILQLTDSDNLSLEHAIRLLDAVNALADDFNDLASDICDDNDIDKELNQAIESISDLWSSLTLTCLNKVRNLQKAH